MAIIFIFDDIIYKKSSSSKLTFKITTFLEIKILKLKGFYFNGLPFKFIPNIFTSTD